jgi:hypothetical protein
MKGQEDKGQDQWLLDGSLLLLVAYNGLFLLDVIFDGAGAARWAGAFMAFIDERRGWVTLFETIASLSVFVDLIVRFDAYENRRRNARVAAIAFCMAGLVFKAFTFYLDSAYLE